MKLQLSEEELWSLAEQIYVDYEIEVETEFREWFSIRIQRLVPSTGSFSEDLQPLHMGYQFGVEQALRRLRENFVHNFKSILEMKGVKLGTGTDGKDN